jgi:uncharacterized protein (TIGR02646 family)
MISVTRGPKPNILVKHENNWLAKLLAATTPREEKLALNKYRHQEILDSLGGMFHGKCAYCESQIRHVAYPNVEHYRPRGGPNGNINLTFVWENLLLACGICNGRQYKSDKFPEVANGGPLLNPCVDNPDDHLEFEYDLNTKSAMVTGKTTRGITTEKVMGLNRIDLQAYRSKQVTRIAAIAKFAASDHDAVILLNEAKQSQTEYSRFAKLF